MLIFDQAKIDMSPHHVDFKFCLGENWLEYVHVGRESVLYDVTGPADEASHCLSKAEIHLQKNLLKKFT